jgi:hypothetical protein
MKVGDLKARLDAENIPPHLYSLTGGELPFEYVGQYCFEIAPDGYHAFFSERRERSEERVFQKEEEACDYFVNWVLEARRRDPPPSKRKGPTLLGQLPHHVKRLLGRY